MKKILFFVVVVASIVNVTTLIQAMVPGDRDITRQYSKHDRVEHQKRAHDRMKTERAGRIARNEAPVNNMPNDHLYGRGPAPKRGSGNRGFGGHLGNHRSW